jgi:4-alpha-glucanotransferase
VRALSSRRSVRGPNPPLCAAQALGKVDVVAEDLGVITPDVVELREGLGLPGMVVLQFAWGSDSRNTHLPHNHYENGAVYVGAACGAQAAPPARGLAPRCSAVKAVAPHTVDQGAG